MSGEVNKKQSRRSVEQNDKYSHVSTYMYFLTNKRCHMIHMPFLVELFNRSLSESLVPSVFKAAYVTPLLKKADLDSADAMSYRPISNLSVLFKLLERLVAQQLIEYLRGAGLLPDLVLQSA